MRATVERDLVYMPPRCYGTPIARSLIVNSPTAQELEKFEPMEQRERHKRKNILR